MVTDVSAVFLLAARKAFSFLEEVHGFEIIEVRAPRGPMVNDLYSVSYRKPLPSSQELFVCLATAPVRLEQDVEVGRGWPRVYHNTIGLSELLAIESPDARVIHASGIYEAFGDLEKLSAQYSALAGALQSHGQRFFANDAALWEDVRSLRQSRNRQREFAEAAQLADTAFRHEDWQRTIELLEFLGENRTPLQTARLAYARKRIAT